MKFERQPSAEFIREAEEKVRRGMGRTSANDYWDCHHVCHYKAEFSARAENKTLRNTMLAPNLWRAAHNALHAACPPVPVPNYQTLQYVIPRINHDLSILPKIDHVSSLVHERRNHPKMKPMEREINDMFIEAIQMQKPFIQQGTLNDKRSIII